MNGDPVIVSALTALLVLSGLAIIIPGIVMLTRRTKLSIYGIKTEGTITAWTERVFSQSPTSRLQRTILFTPRVHYIANGGTRYDSEMDRSYADDFRTLNPVGSNIPLRYLPSAPHRIYDPAYASIFTLPLALTLAGLLLLLLAAGMFFGSHAT